MQCSKGLRGSGVKWLILLTDNADSRRGRFRSDNKLKDCEGYERKRFSAAHWSGEKPYADS